MKLSLNQKKVVALSVIAPQALKFLIAYLSLSEMGARSSVASMILLLSGYTVFMPRPEHIDTVVDLNSLIQLRNGLHYAVK